MTSEQIRMRLTDTRWDGAPLYLESNGATPVLLVEIAAQLAELNETLKKIADPTGGIMVGLCATNDDIPVRVKE